MSPKNDLAEINKRISALEDKVASLSAPTLKRRWEWVLSHKLTTFLWSLLLCVVGILGKYYLDHRNDGFNDSVDKRITIKLDAPKGVNERLEAIQQSTNRIEGSLEALNPFIQSVVAHQFETVSKLPTQTLLERLPAVNNLLAVAKDQHVNIQPQIISKIGTDLIGESSEHPPAWKTAISLVEYKTANTEIPLEIPKPIQVSYDSHYNFETPGDDLTPPKVGTIGEVPREQAAQLNHIGNDMNKDVPGGPAFLLADGGELVLDSMQLRNVILRGVHVFYSGGPVVLNNVYFINCVFVMTSNKNTHGLAVAALSPSPSITFNTAAKGL
jgi:hypothetical protein